MRLQAVRINLPIDVLLIRFENDTMCHITLASERFANNDCNIDYSF